MTYARRSVELPEHPVLVVGVEGWIDPGYAAAAAVASLLEQFDTRTFCVFDTDEFIDHRARRPRVRIKDGVRGRVYWPGPRLRVGTDGNGRGVALLVGPEPDYHWQEFAGEVRDLVRELGTRLIVGLGAFPTATPHTRPIIVTSTASERGLARQVGFMPGIRDRPARMIDVIGAYCADVGVPSIGLSARVPHYVETSPYPEASVALLDALAAVSGLTVDTAGLRRASETTRKQLDELIAESEEHTTMVQQLEAQHDASRSEVVSNERVPTGDEIAEELERYLRGDLQ
ncbi:MAG TPA: PAC2 family protein [Acidimicrobiales bacterium]|nr:PAC2 family protein [Acidimicrobiales bacterium]